MKITWGFTPGCHIAGLRPSDSRAVPEQRRIVAELDALQAEVDVLKRLQAETSVNPRLLSRLLRPSIALGFGEAENRSLVFEGEESPNTTGRDAA